MNSTSHLLLLFASGLVAGAISPAAQSADESKKPSSPKPALSVNVVQPQRAEMPLRIAANGSIAAWQEASIGSELSGLRLAEVRVDLGDAVKRGQVLATFSAETVQSETAQVRASVAEAEATLAEAAANAQRARDMQASGMLSAQAITQMLTAERTAQARLDVQRALLNTQQIRVQHTQVLAPDDGVISARAATVGAVVAPGMELFRMIRQGRLEWRAEVSASELARIRPGLTASLTPVGGAPITGRVRMIGPMVDPQTRNGIVFVDIGASGGAKPGMFARGEFNLGASSSLTLPQTAVLLRDGFSYVLVVGADSKVALAKVSVGRRSGEQVEIVSGLDSNARVVAAGGGFLGDGDLVRVVGAAAPGASRP
ncbi:MAG: efflux RND transporter periplasmic adaptor subunit [Burkholderiaceae bacterium]